MDKYIKLKMFLLLIMLISFGRVTIAQEKIEGYSGSEKPEVGISITFPIYSGRANPQWWLTEGQEFQELIELIKIINSVDDSLFNYNEWNRGGYASFWIDSRNIKDIPKSIHIWRDMAIIISIEDEQYLYANGVLELYDLLVKLAEEKGYKEYFINYHQLGQND